MLIQLVMPPVDCRRKIIGKSVYKLYVMIKIHFSGKFDIIQYNWSGVKISNSAYDKRKDKHFFERLSGKFSLGDLYKIFLSNMLANPDAWVGEISGADALIFYTEYKSKLERASYIYREDLENLVNFCAKKNILFPDLFNCRNGHPLIFKMIQQEVISYETFLLINAGANFIDKFDKDMKSDIIWTQYRTRLLAYKKLLNIDEIKARTILEEILRK